MPQASAAYAVSRIRVLEGKQVTTDLLLRMTQCATAPEALRMLSETTLGEGLSRLENPADYDTLLWEDEQRCADLLREITPEPSVTDCLLIPTDTANLKLSAKCRAQHLAAPVLSRAGTVPTETVAKAMESRDYSALPKPFAACLQALDEDEDPTPRTIELALDRAGWIMVLEQSDPYPFYAELFREKAQVQNLLTVLRIRRMGLEDGPLTEQAWIPVAGQSLQEVRTWVAGDALADGIFGKPYGPALIPALEALERTGSFGPLERAAEGYFLRYIRQRHAEPFDVAPLVEYFMARQAERRAVRTVLVGIENRMPVETVRERLREMYG